MEEDEIIKHGSRGHDNHSYGRRSGAQRDSNSLVSNRCMAQARACSCVFVTSGWNTLVEHRFNGKQFDRSGSTAHDRKVCD